MKQSRVIMRCVLLGLLIIGGGLSFKASVEAAHDKSPVEEENTIRTLENQTILSGKAPVGTVISCAVYNYRYTFERAILYTTQETVGESGLYQITVPLPVEGTQYVQLVMNGELKTYRFERCAKKTVQQIREFYLNIDEYLEDETH